MSNNEFEQQQLHETTSLVDKMKLYTEEMEKYLDEFQELNKEYFRECFLKSVITGEYIVDTNKLKLPNGK